jgi:aminoglycoside 3-N-acetyltransferase
VPTFGALGVITDTLAAREDAVSSIHPKARVAAVGAAAEAICRDHWKADMAHGPDTPYTRIAEMGGYVCLMGVDQDRNTTLHTVEECLELPYLKTTADVTFQTPEGEVTRAWDYFPGPHRDFIGIEPALIASGKLRVGRIGNAVVRVIRSAELIQIATQLGRQDPAFVLCDNPECLDCVTQRADIRRARFQKEAFRVAAATSLAGTYPDEIADTCIRCGIDSVEVDLIRGLPLTRIQPARLRQAVVTLRNEGLNVSALRLLSTGQTLDAILDLAAELDVPRLVTPLTHNAAAEAAKAAEKSIRIAFANVALDAATALDICNRIVEEGYAPRLVMSPAQFAAAGENPFLKSFRQGLRKFIDQIDVEDGTFDGRPARLAGGNAEIKEIISILRCRTFSGHMVLSGRNRPIASLMQTAEDFEALLRKM